MCTPMVESEVILLEALGYHTRKGFGGLAGMMSWGAISAYGNTTSDAVCTYQKDLLQKSIHALFCVGSNQVPSRVSLFQSSLRQVLS